MGKKKKQISYKNNREFFDNLYLNDQTFADYLNRFTKIALSMFEWVNLPSSMNALFLEKTLFTDGKATLLKHKDYGFINTRCSSNGYVNIYDLPTSFNCYSHDLQEDRDLYTGIDMPDSEFKECILVQNTFDGIPTYPTLELFAYRLYEAESTAFTNIKAQKTPILILTDENQVFSMTQLYTKYDGNNPVIYGDKNLLDTDKVTVLKTDAPFIADKIMDYKKEIWNECLTFLRY